MNEFGFTSPYFQNLKQNYKEIYLEKWNISQKWKSPKFSHEKILNDLCSMSINESSLCIATEGFDETIGSINFYTISDLMENLSIKLECNYSRVTTFDFSHDIFILENGQKKIFGIGKISTSELICQIEPPIRQVIGIMIYDGNIIMFGKHKAFNVCKICTYSFVGELLQELQLGYFETIFCIQYYGKNELVVGASEGVWICDVVEKKKVSYIWPDVQEKVFFFFVFFSQKIY